jgi:uncharacterized membrane-anchored protein
MAIVVLHYYVYNLNYFLVFWSKKMIIRLTLGSTTSNFMPGLKPLGGRALKARGGAADAPVSDR